MRNKRLDVLRCVAIMLVLLYHGGARLAWFGWVGVDLFFVLSGFLISGLLFAEYNKRGSISFKLFFIRRGLKIYPAFYFFILFNLCYQLTSHKGGGTLSQYLSEALYIGNYGHYIWGHIWSLDVEEHFYILLPVLLLLLIRRSPGGKNPFWAIPWAFLVVATVCLTFRIATIRSLAGADLHDWMVYRAAYATTHCRMDSLFFGVLLGYLHHFRPDFLDRLLTPAANRVALTLLAIALLSCALILPVYHPLMLTAGLTLLYVGFGIVLLLSLRVHGVLPVGFARLLERVGTPLAFMGMYSYSIYLWHQAFGGFGPGVVRHILHFQLAGLPEILFNFVGSIMFGILISRLIEYPILRLRDRIFPVLQPISVATQQREG
jgi:peptidoglycan/LPS O-acetylase OafA/YrhL